MTERDELVANISASLEAMKKIEFYENELEYLSENRRKARGVGSFVLFYLVGAVLGGLLMMIFANVNDMSGLIVFSMFILPILVPIIARIIRTKHYDKKIAETTPELIEAKNTPVLNWLPVTYRNSVSFSYIASYIQNMRANTLAEALNLFETEKHQARLEAKATSITKISLF